jgi:hypothetical protein
MDSNYASVSHLTCEVRNDARLSLSEAAGLMAETGSLMPFVTIVLSVASQDIYDPARFDDGGASLFTAGDDLNGDARSRSCPTLALRLEC